MIFRLVPLAFVAALSGCIFVPIVVPAPPGAPGSFTVYPGDPCGARSVSSFIGQPEVAVTGNRFVTPGPMRILRVGDSVGTEVIDNRLNFVIGADGRVADITCG